MRALVAMILCLPLGATAFCGFYVGSAGDTLVNNATSVVLFRHDDTTVLSMQNDYQGPPKKFALVVPVPVVLKEGDVKTLDRQLFKRIDRLAAPRLVEYWEQDPCFKPSYGMGSGGGMGLGRGAGGLGVRGMGGARPMVRVEAQFAVGEYEIVVLSADDSAALDTWLRDNKYNIPPGAEAALRPYVASGMKFFVAKVNPAKVKFTKGRAVLSPLRVAYRSDDLRLPVRLGLLNSTGKQDLVVHVLAKDRYEAANYPNVTIPTNLDVTDDVRASFGEFYAALFDATLAKNPGAVVTEYAWQASKCDPCPGPVVSATDLASLGGDITLDLKAPANQGVAVAQAKLGVEGPLDRDIIRRVLRRQRRSIQYCVEHALARKPQALRETYGARFVIEPTGRTAKVETTKALPGELAQVCLERRLKRMRFPQPPAKVQVDLKWLFRPVSRSVGARNPAMGFVLTRLHYRYDKNGLGEDLVFAAAKPISGGREIRLPAAKKPQPKPVKKPPPKKVKESAKRLPADDKLIGIFGEGAMVGIGDLSGLSGAGLGAGFFPNTGELESGAKPSSANNFQARYAIRHGWSGKVECKEPVYGRWGSKTGGGSRPASASGMAPTKRGTIKLDQAVPAGIPELGIVKGR